jgi:GR25 family glycosyltransferase involved in LPS biosynthesis
VTTSSVLETSQQIGRPPADAWSGFDRIYCISLTHRADRREMARQEFARIGLAERVQFVIVDSHPTDSEQGIFESHMSCLRAGLAAGAQNIVVFEDDILIRRFSPKVLANAIRFMKSTADWHMFFFGCFVRSSRKTPFESVLKIRYRCTAHAYVVNRTFAQKLVEIPWRGVAYDDLLRSMQDERFYACYPAFAFQSGSSTDNHKLRGIDRARRLTGGLYRLQRWNEFSHRRLVTLIVVHVLIVLLLSAVALHHRFG